MIVLRARSRATVIGLVIAALSLLSSPARAQLHWDASAQAGVVQRILVDRPSGNSPQARLGPAAQLMGHVALFPLVRVGAYLGQEISPMSGSTSARDFTWGGVRAKVMSPWPRGSLRAWLFLGFGYSRVYARSTSFADGSLTHGAAGGSFEVPFGVGASYVLRKPFALVAELGMRTNFGNRGSAYDLPGPQAEAGRTAGHAPPAGMDRIAFGLTLGVLADL